MACFWPGHPAATAGAARILAKELLEYEVKVSEDANDRYGMFRVGSQNDLVIALGLALHDDGLRRAIIVGG